VSDDVRDVIIVGSGPAGYAAAIYAARAALRPLVFEGAVTAGGALMTTTEVDNFPGFPSGIQGPDLMDNLRAQAERFGADLVRDDVTAVRLAGDVKEVDTGDPQYGGITTHRARAVILATGSAYRKLGVPGEESLSGHGVSWCATCDGFFYKGQDIAVIGGGDSAVQEATFLTRFARSVTLVHRRDTLRASKIMQARAFANRPGQGPGRPRRRQLHHRRPPEHGDQPARRVRLRRRRRPHPPAGHHRRRNRLLGRPGRRTLPRHPHRHRGHSGRRRHRLVTTAAAG
jgi:thioredoxin reductase